MFSIERVKFDRTKESLKTIIDKRVMTLGKEKAMRGEYLIIGSTQDKDALLKDVKNSQVSYKEPNFKAKPVLINCEIYEVEYENMMLQLALDVSWRSGVLQIIQTEIDIIPYDEIPQLELSEEEFQPIEKYKRYAFDQMHIPVGKITFK